MHKAFRVTFQNALVTIFFNFIFYYLFCVHRRLACMYICVPSVHGVCRNNKRVSGPLELELQIVTIHHMGAGNQTWLL